MISVLNKAQVSLKKKPKQTKSPKFGLWGGGGVRQNEMENPREANSPPEKGRALLLPSVHHLWCLGYREKERGEAELRPGS